LTRPSIKANDLLGLHPRQQTRWNALRRRHDLVRRVYEHREGLAESFTKRYGVKMLVYFEPHDTIATALQREKNIKHWSREWKIDLIVASNPDWRDLYDEIVR
jgi:putative endonuclease